MTKDEIVSHCAEHHAVFVRFGSHRTRHMVYNSMAPDKPICLYCWDNAKNYYLVPIAVLEVKGVKRARPRECVRCYD